MVSIPIAKKSLGQHWLQDATALTAMCQAADVGSGDNVLEIGPGFGTLSQHLLNYGAHVVALEFDETLIPPLRQKFAIATKDGRFSVVHGDIRTYDLTQLPPDYKVVANIPYYLTSNLMQLLSETINKPAAAALLMQKEVAERICAPAGDMSILSLTTQFYWQVSLGVKVPAKLFVPPPKVDSQILIIQRRNTLAVTGSQIQDFFRLVKAGFSQRRKTLLNSLSAGLRLDKAIVGQMCQAALIDPSRRPQTLAMAEWLALFSAYKQSS